MDDILKEIKLEKYRQLLERSVGTPCRVALCDLLGDPIAVSGDGGAQSFAEVAAELSDSDPEWRSPARRSGRFDARGKRTLLWSPIDEEQLGAVGRLAVLVDSPESDLDGVSGLDAGELSHVAQCIAEECRLNKEISGLVDELANRYEELTLVYSIDDYARSLSEGPTGIRAFLSSLAEYFRVDVAVYVKPDEPAPLYATNLSRPIENLDLVLVETRGALFRFVSSARSPIVMNVEDDRRQFLFKDLPFKVLACPLVHCTHVEGMIALLRHADGPDFTNSDRNLANVVVAQAAVLLRDQSLILEAREFTEQMAGAMIKTVEAKDCYTAGHSERVERIAIELGRSLKLQGGDMKELFWGGLLHDVGKIAVPDVILTKPARLTADEFTLMKTHPEQGYEILRHIESLGQRALDGVRHHHERFDGAGYPHGLSGCGIPLHARIIAVADTYDAITSSRAYRTARTHDEALKEIRLVAGMQLDPELVTVFDRKCGEDRSWLEEIRAYGRFDG